MTEFLTAFPPLGRIQPALGSTSDILVNFPDLRDEEFFVHLILFQADPTNSGRVYIGDATLDVATKVGINYILAYAGDSFAIDAGMVLNTIDARGFRVAVDQAGDGVYISAQLR